MNPKLTFKSNFIHKSGLSFLFPFLLLSQLFVSPFALAQQGTVPIAYDDNGNMTQDESGNRYEYDGENRLISFVKGDGTVKTAYTYYADGLRKSKQITLKDKSASDPILFYYDHAQNANVINEVQGSGNKAVTSSYLMVGDTRYARYLSNDPSGVQYYVKNHKDTTMTVGSGGQNPTSHAYTPYGVERAATTGMASAGTQTSDFSIASNPFLYSSQYTDQESGLQYLRARYYKADHMRFISRDTNSVPRNKYAYANGNPIMEDDPSGMMADWVKSFLSVGAGIVAGAVIELGTGGAGSAAAAVVGGAISGAISSAAESGVSAALNHESYFSSETLSGIALGAGLGAVGGGIGSFAAKRTERVVGKSAKRIKFYNDTYLTEMRDDAQAEIAARRLAAKKSGEVDKTLKKPKEDNFVVADPAKDVERSRILGILDQMDANLNPPPPPPRFVSMEDAIKADSKKGDLPNFPLQPPIPAVRIETGSVPISTTAERQLRSNQFPVY